MMIQFDQDEIVEPKESELFGNKTMAADGTYTSLKMEDSDLYKEDWLGLKYLDSNGRLFQQHINNTHTTFSDDEMANIFLPFIMS